MMQRCEENDGGNQRIRELIREYIKNYQTLNQTETSWKEPVIGFADAEDELFYSLPRIIGPDYALPTDILPEARSVIAYFIPFTEETVESNVDEVESSSEWDYANIETNRLLSDLNRYLHDVLQKEGYHASILPPTYQYDEEELVSNWSHKSVAYIAGLGKFGIHHLLITEKGCCGRFGSVVTDMELVPSEKPKEEFCLYRYDGSCGKCMERCVADAFCRQGLDVYYDRQKCNDQIYNGNLPKYLNGVGDTCGKCMCGVPCSYVNPVSKIQTF